MTALKYAMALAVAMNVLSFANAYAEQTRATFPADLDKLVHYTTIRRGEVTEHILTTPKAIQAIKDGKPVPSGTHFVLVDYRDGKVFRYFISQKGDGWGADYDEDRRTGDWHFQAFKPDKTINEAENPARCQSCHSSRSDREFLFTFDAIGVFDGTVTE